MRNETTASTQEPMSLAQAHEWKYLAQKAGKQRVGALARLKDMTAQRDIWRGRAEKAEAALAETSIILDDFVKQTADWRENAQQEHRRAEAVEAVLAECQAEIVELRKVNRARFDENKEIWAALKATLARAEKSEAALTERDEPCECWMAHHGEPMHGNRHCSNCGHPIKAPVAQKCTWTPLHFGGIVVGCTSAPWDGDVPEVCPHCLKPVDIGELSY